MAEGKVFQFLVQTLQPRSRGTYDAVLFIDIVSMRTEWTCHCTDVSRYRGGSGRTSPGADPALSGRELRISNPFTFQLVCGRSERLSFSVTFLLNQNFPITNCTSQFRDVYYLLLWLCSETRLPILFCATLMGFCIHNLESVLC
jgi:hypothetical protein